MNLTVNECHINDLKGKKVNNHLYRKVRMCEIRTKNLEIKGMVLISHQSLQPPPPLRWCEISGQSPLTKEKEGDLYEKDYSLIISTICWRNAYASCCNCAFKLRSIFGNTGVLFDLLAVCISPREFTIQDDCSHIFHRIISMRGESINANCNRK